MFVNFLNTIRNRDRCQVPASIECALSDCFQAFLHENGAKLGNTQSMLTFFKNNSGKYGITPSNKIKIKGETRKVRGFKGMRPCFTRYPSGNAGLGPVAYSTNVTIEDTSYDDD